MSLTAQAVKVATALSLYKSPHRIWTNTLGSAQTWLIERSETEARNLAIVFECEQLSSKGEAMLLSYRSEVVMHLRVKACEVGHRNIKHELQLFKPLRQPQLPGTEHQL